MATLETSKKFTRIDDTVSGEINVYVDASWNPSSESTEPFTYGWTIANHDIKQVEGYGVEVVDYADDFHSGIAEFRGVARFLDTIANDFQHLMVPENTFIIHCDSQSVTRDMNCTRKGNDEWMRSRFADDYDRIIRYGKKTNLKFRWVKGHSTNKFNRAADRFARKSFRLACAGESFDGVQRIRYMHSVLSAYQIMSTDEFATHEAELLKMKREYQAQSKDFEFWNSGVSLYASCNARKSNDELKLGIAYMHDETGDHFQAVETHETNWSKSAIELRAVQAVLFQYRTSDSFDASKPITILTDMRCVQNVVNCLTKGIPPMVNASDENLAEGIKHVKMLMDGIHVRVINEKTPYVKVTSKLAKLARLEENDGVSPEEMIESLLADIVTD